MRVKSYPASKSELCVMIVEDNDHMRTLLRTLLKAMEIRRIVEFKEGAEALAQLGHERPDFIVTDLSMAPMDGLQFTRSVRHLPDESQCVTPIIMVTGHTERRRIEVARDAGVNEILAKPVTAAGLFQRIDLIVNRPRPFVRTADYVGPCRRRKRDPHFNGPWLRSSDAERLEKDRTDRVEVEEVSAVGSSHLVQKF
jgi:two-component system chemotaxis response regulator CheY